MNAEVVEGEFQEKDVVTQEPSSSKLTAETPIQAKAEGWELQKEHVVTQEPAYSPRVFAEVPMKAGTVETLI